MSERMTPEEAGISSDRVREFAEILDTAGMATHSILMAKGNHIFAELYYKPFDEKFLHRMYSISKSFAAVAVGLAYTEGLLSLDDIVMDYFPELKDSNPNDYKDETTILDLLTMRSNICGFTPWYQKCDSRMVHYFTSKAVNKIPGTLYYYDSVGAYILCCIVEKITGKEFLEYLKEKVLLELGFSKESYTLHAPGGYTIGDSGVMCTTKDLFIFARLVANYGEWNGRQYIDRDYMKAAVTKQSYGDIKNGMAGHGSCGYGYLIYCMPNGGFSFYGLGDQLVIYDSATDFTFVITSDNQVDGTNARTIIYHEVYRTLINHFSPAPLEENAAAYRRLCQYMESRELVVQRGELNSPLAEKVNGVRYSLCANPMNMEYFSLNFEKDGGLFCFKKDGMEYELPFGIGRNVRAKFPENKRQLLVMGDLGEGHYDCAVSAAWGMENQFIIKTQIIDTYLGCLTVHISFKADRAELQMVRSGQYLLDGFEGYASGKVK